MLQLRREKLGLGTHEAPVARDLRALTHAEARARMRVTERVQHVPTAITLQFVSTFGVWMLAEQIGLSGVLTVTIFR